MWGRLPAGEAGGWTQRRTEQVILHTGTAWIKAGRPEDKLGEETARGSV